MDSISIFFTILVKKGSICLNIQFTDFFREFECTCTLSSSDIVSLHFISI